MGINIALAGNPNSGKTTLFNELTGANQYVGNWPGVTVEKKEGKYKRDKDVTITDLPGIYSLSPYTPEEIVSRDYLMSGEPNVVVDLVDANNLERNLYLTTQIVDLGIPVVIALNMMDLVEKNGDRIDVDTLSQKLGCPIVETSALRGRGVDDVMTAAQDAAKEGLVASSPMRFSDEVEMALSRIIDVLGDRVNANNARWYAIKLFENESLTIDAFNLSDEDRKKIDAIRESVETAEDDDAESIITNERYDVITDVCNACVKKAPKKMTTTQKIDRVVTNRIAGLPIFIVIMAFVYFVAVSIGGGIVTDWANDAISGDGWLYTGGAAFEEATEEWEGLQEDIDTYFEAAAASGISENEIESAQDFLAMEEPEEDADAEEIAEYDEGSASLAAFIRDAGAADVVAEIEDEESGEVEAFDIADFEAAIEVKEPDPTDGTWGAWVPGLSAVASQGLEAIGCAAWLESLIVDGIIAGVGAVIGFIPQMLILFLFLAFLEGCGYMARVAFIMDRIFRRFGLSGKSFIPMLIASGCGVPALMATKTIENEKDRRMTIMTTTMIPCGAKMPIIALVFGAIAGGDSAATWWIAPLFYFLGLAAIIISCIMLKKFRAFAGKAAPFIMELPQYHLPTVRNVLQSMWERVRGYIVKAGTIIFLSTIVIWFLMNFGVYEGTFGLLDPDMDGYLDYSIMAMIGSALSFIFAPLGFGNWESTVATVTGLVAKENVVATVGVLTSLGEVGEDNPTLWAAFGTMIGGGSVAIMAFCAFNLLCAPCFASIGTIRNQMSSAKWTWATIGYMTLFAWCVALMIYQFGGLATGEVGFGPWTIVAAVIAALLLFQLFRPMPKYEDEDSGKPMAELDNKAADVA